MESKETPEVDFTSFKVKPKEVRVNGVPTPLAIGDKIQMSKGTSAKTVTTITVFEDGRIMYGLEWYDESSGQFETESVTLTELKLLHKNSIKKAKLGF